MGWSNVAGTVISVTTVIVSGTTDSGIFIYNGTPGPGTLVGSIAATAGTDPYGNVYARGLNFGDQQAAHFGVDVNGNVYIINSADETVIRIEPNSDGLYVYTTAGAGLGNQSVSLASSAGTDAYGNHHLPGVTSYSTTEYSALTAGMVTLGPLSGAAGSTPDTVDAASLLYAPGNGLPALPYLQVSSPLATPGGYTDAALIIASPGFPNAGQAPPDQPTVVFIDNDANSGVLVGTSAAFIKVQYNGDPYAWQTPVYTGPFVGGGFANELDFQYRLDGADNLVPVGAVTTTSNLAAGADTTLFTLPAAYRPLEGVRWPIYQSTGTGVVAFMIVQKSGAVIIMNPTAAASGTVFETAGALIPMGNIA